MKLYSQEWSEFIESSDIESKPLKVDLSMPEKNKKLVCKRLGIAGIDSVEATIKLTRSSVTKVIHAGGSLKAEIRQNCVITAEELERSIKEDFEGWFADPSEAVSFEKARRERLNQKEKEELPVMEEAEDPEPVIEGKIDLGELVVQHLALAIEPYPRKPGADLGLEGKEDRTDDYDYTNPFAKLKDWKEKG